MNLRRAAQAIALAMVLDAAAHASGAKPPEDNGEDGGGEDPQADAETS